MGLAHRRMVVSTGGWSSQTQTGTGAVAVPGLGLDSARLLPTGRALSPGLCSRISELLAFKPLQFPSEGNPLAP